MLKVSIMETGLWDVPRNEMIQAETPEIYAENRRYTISGYCVLIRDPEIGTVLWDTGIAQNWEEIWPEQFKKDYSFHKLYRLDEKLAEQGLTPADIDLLICSHLHYDHAGNISLFRNTKAGQKILISEAEAKEAFVKTAMSPNGVSGAYFRDEIIMDGIGYQTISEDTWLTENICLFIQKGHTPGVIGLLLRTENSGNFMFVSDAVYSKVNMGPPIVLPGLCVDPDSYRANIERIYELQKKYDAKIVFGHDVEDFKQWKTSPYWYE